MKAFFALLGLSFKSLLINSVNIGRGKNKKSRSISGVGALVFLSVLCLYLSGTYSMLLGSTLGPWLAGLYVDPDYRKNGVGQALIEAVKDKARAMGYPKLYLRTEFAGGYYRRLGWCHVQNAVDQYGLKPEVFEWTL